MNRIEDCNTPTGWRDTECSTSNIATRVSCTRTLLHTSFLVIGTAARCDHPEPEQARDTNFYLSNTPGIQAIA